MERYTDLMCVCSPDDRATAEACFDRVLAELECDPSDVLTAVVRALEFGLDDDHSASITGIACDQWAVVNATVFEYVDGRAVDFATVSVQCDRVEHGVARAWELARDSIAAV